MILSNQVRCSACGDAPYSAFRNDFKPCKCGAVCVDGGMSYLRRVFGAASPEYEELSITVSDEAARAARIAIENAIETGRNSLGILCAAVIALRDAGYTLAEKD